ncbi:PilW family protein [Aquabacterium sp.]|uniref:PilW family protein n=1 Tax=Aquabacterium sp. TaxID=1872578 RepID=UPI0025B89036|nr:PilW family protein [Aquabacterium sp.]
MCAPRSPSPQGQRGFTLVEMMVGLLLAMLTTIIVAQVMVKAEGNRRATTSGADAQVNGALALFSLQRDIQSAGYGLAVNPSALGCTVNYAYNNTVGSFPLAPVVITQGASGAPDTIRVLSSAKGGFSVPVVTTAPHAVADNYATVKSAFGTGAADLVVAVPSTYGTGLQCALMQVAEDASYTVGDTIIPHVTGGPWNPSSSATRAAIMPTNGYASGSTMVNLGSMVNRIFRINNASLVYNELTATSGTETNASANGLSPERALFSEIVNLQALYGIDTDGDRLVDTYTDATPTTFTGWQQVMSVRLVVVARSANVEREVVTDTQPQWDLGSNATIVDTTATSVTCLNANSSNCVQLKVDGDANWQHHRYRVYDTVIPLRNLLWNS